MSATPFQECYTCHISSKQLFVCIQCNNFALCDDCWSQWPLHLEGTVGWGGRPHEKSESQVVQTLREILDPTRTSSERESEFGMDYDTTWFGVGRDDDNQGVFQDYGRFATLMGENPMQELGSRYPQLIAGAGKSTLIKILIDRLGILNNGAKFPSPATSSYNGHVPTTEDVHLYADPNTYDTRTPLLYADCEGLDGGEAVPEALRWQGKDETTKAPKIVNGVQDILHEKGPSLYSNVASNDETPTPEPVKKSSHAYQRHIAWAETPETAKRSMPAFESTVLGKLLAWVAVSIDKLPNQPALPRAIIVLNATEKVDDDEWDIETATRNFLHDVSRAIDREPSFRELAQMWRDAGRTTKTTKDLLSCYYASISVIRIPSSGRYMLIDNQMGQLFQLINHRSQESLRKKKKLRMVATADKLQTYLFAAYNHFCRDLDTPFDFIKEALKYNPIPQHFGGNILDLAISIKRNSQHGGTMQQIFEKMVPMISSCIMLHSVRQKLSGHQDKNGMQWDEGDYQSDVYMQQFGEHWIAQMRSHLDQLHEASSSHLFQEQSDNQIAEKLHKQQLADFYHSLGNATGLGPGALKHLPPPLFLTMCLFYSSTGGIIALGLGVNNWSVDECINNFKEICSKAFTKRELVSIPILDILANLNHGSMYKTKPFEAILQQMFQADRPLFGGADDQSETHTKVAVTATTSIEQQPVILTNYNRPDIAENEAPYRFVRSSNPSRDFKVWEAARATSAAPLYRQAFTKTSDNSSYIDGAMYHNCPVAVAHHERQMIWPDIANRVPDILLSIGTGSTKAEKSEQAPRHDPDFSQSHKPKKTLIQKQVGKIIFDRLERLPASNTIWTEFLSDIGPQAYDSTRDGKDNRYIRVNPEFPFKVPRLDAVEDLPRLVIETKRYTDSHQMRIKEIAHRLVASSFFFEKYPGTVRACGERFQCSGRICCRLSSTPRKMKALGYFFHDCVQDAFEPHFILGGVEAPMDEAQRIPISETIISGMCNRGVFSMEDVNVTVSKELSVTNISLCLQFQEYSESRNAFLPISGFPRELMSEDIKDSSRPRPLRYAPSLNQRVSGEFAGSSNGGPGPPSPESLVYELEPRLCW
ncbi:hypothetical protein CMUS01_11936 [Colletotrichum musicola]|uniref:PNPLA domain-containing protein n=1 Tax=Colletotrichum musicola TaxID=2175873 RepID=A0A8H6N2W6_9PEZI|nr:hypothetical protein CMUS01_11936 [Colletotrichum musicola]